MNTKNLYNLGALLILSITSLFITSLFSYALANDSVQVSSFYGSYDPSTKSSGQQALSLRGPKLESWNSPEKVDKPYVIGVSIPHLKDSYWLAVNYGIAKQAEELGVSFKLLSAGGYDQLAKQQRQLNQLADIGVDGIILGSISYSGNNQVIDSIAAKGIPVIEIINDIEAGSITAKSLVSYYDMGFFAGEFVVEQADSIDSEEIKVAFLPGPKGSGWADDTLTGFQAATEFAGKPINVIDVKWGDTGATVQTQLVREALASNPTLDYIVGNAVAADVATDVIAELGLSTQIISTYITRPIYDKISKQRIAAAPADMTVYQAQIAMDMMVKMLSGSQVGVDIPFRTGPMIPVITQENIEKHPFEQLFGTRTHSPVFDYTP